MRKLEQLDPDVWPVMKKVIEQVAGRNSTLRLRWRFRG
jgi:hypothetical protein